jgi:hypothetical protein
LIGAGSSLRLKNGYARDADGMKIEDSASGIPCVHPCNDALPTDILLTYVNASGMCAEFF